MSHHAQGASMRTVVLFVVLVPVIVYLLNFAYKKNKESEVRTLQCKEGCEEQGYPGYDFKWTVLDGPQCECIGDVE